MKPKWVLEKHTFEDNFDDLVTKLQEKSIEYKILDYVPFEGGKYKYKEIYPENSCVICYSSINFLRRLQRETNLWIPHSYANFDNYTCGKYYPHFWKYLLNTNFIFIPFGLLENRQEFIFNMFPENVFVRPDSGTKIFTGKVVAKDEFKEFIKIERDCYQVDDEVMVLLSEAYNLSAEWRFIVCRDQVITGSKYRSKGKLVGELTSGGPAWDFAQKVLDEVKYRPDRAFTLDICQCGDEYYLLEINSFSACGLYKCDLDIVVDEISKLAIEDWKEMGL